MVGGGKDLIVKIGVMFLIFVSVGCVSAQSTDAFIMPGTDFIRPGLYTRSNLNIGVGHTFSALGKNPIGSELTAGYTYENSGTHGWLYSGMGAHTEAIGSMRNFSFGKSHYGAYLWSQIGITSITGGAKVKNALYTGQSLGFVIHLTSKSGIWVQESYSKLPTIPWYTTTGVGYVFSF